MALIVKNGIACVGKGDRRRQSTNYLKYQAPQATNFWRQIKIFETQNV